MEDDYEFMLRIKEEKIISEAKGNSSLIKGCSSEEIEFLEAKFNAKLPSIYKTFLSAFGNSTIVLFADWRHQYHHVVSFNEKRSYYFEDAKIEIQDIENYFIIGDMQPGFLYFDLTEDKLDPIVYGGVYGGEDIGYYPSRFTTFVLEDWD